MKQNYSIHLQTTNSALLLFFAPLCAAQIALCSMYLDISHSGQSAKRLTRRIVSVQHECRNGLKKRTESAENDGDEENSNRNYDVLSVLCNYLKCAPFLCDQCFFFTYRI